MEIKIMKKVISKGLTIICLMLMMIITPVFTPQKVQAAGNNSIELKYEKTSDKNYEVSVWVNSADLMTFDLGVYFENATVISYEFDSSFKTKYESNFGVTACGLQNGNAWIAFAGANPGSNTYYSDTCLCKIVLVNNGQRMNIELKDMMNDETIIDELVIYPGDSGNSTQILIPKVLGDVYVDGNINATDALSVLKHAAKISTLNSNQKSMADVNKDGNINATDALWILKYAARIIDSFDDIENELNTSKSVIDRYGYFYTDNEYQKEFNGSSNLEFEIIENTVVDMGGFYRVKARFLEGIKVRSDIKIGESVSVVVNGITGDKKTLKCVDIEDRWCSLVDTDGEEYYFDLNDTILGYSYLYQYSWDRANRVVYEGYISIKKGVDLEVLVDDLNYELDYNRLKDGEYIQRLFFDDAGYVVRAMYTSD